MENELILSYAVDAMRQVRERIVREERIGYKADEITYLSRCEHMLREIVGGNHEKP